MNVHFTKPDMSAAKKKSSAKPAAKSRGKGKPIKGPVRRTPAKYATPKAKGRSENLVKAVVPVSAPLPKLPAHLIAAVKAIDDKKGYAIQVLELGQLSSIADYLVVASGNSEPHLRALRIEVERALDDAGARARGTESQKESGWTVVDAFDIIFHIFREDVRKSYSLETLWKDGRDIPVAAILKN